MGLGTRSVLLPRLSLRASTLGRSLRNAPSSRNMATRFPPFFGVSRSFTRLRDSGAGRGDDTKGAMGATAFQTGFTKRRFFLS